MPYVLFDSPLNTNAKLRVWRKQQPPGDALAENFAGLQNSAQTQYDNAMQELLKGLTYDEEGDMSDPSQLDSNEPSELGEQVQLQQDLDITGQNPVGPEENRG